MATDLLLIREGNHLVPAEPISYEAIQDMAHGEVVTATIRRARNYKHHQKLFVMLTLIVNNQECYLTPEDLLDDIKIGIGYARKVPSRVDPRGYRLEPKSISFANMGQDKFNKFWNKAVAFIITDILPGIDKDDLEREVYAMIQPN